jgi:hypothetical protein
MTERFTLLSELGRGGMGVVWKARDEETGQIVALKLLREAYTEDPEYLARFERELELAKRIDSVHVVKVLGFGVREKMPYLALEYVEGPSLQDALAKHGPYSWPETKALLIQLTQGLADANAAGVIHRDVKPANVLIGPDGVAKLTDFGISRGLDTTRMTATSTMLGTPAYLAPEGPKDARSDLYSLGIIGYQLLTGAVPFKGTSHQEVIFEHVRTAPDLGKLPPEARPIIGMLLAKDPAERPARASALLPILYGVTPTPMVGVSAAAGPAPLVAQPPVPPVPPSQPSAPIAYRPGGPAWSGPSPAPAQPRALLIANRRKTWPLVAVGGALALIVCLVAGAFAAGLLPPGSGSNAGRSAAPGAFSSTGSMPAPNAPVGSAITPSSIPTTGTTLGAANAQALSALDSFQFTEAIEGGTLGDTLSLLPAASTDNATFQLKGTFIHQPDKAADVTVAGSIHVINTGGFDYVDSDGTGYTQKDATGGSYADSLSPVAFFAAIDFSKGFDSKGSETENGVDAEHFVANDAGVAALKQMGSVTGVPDAQWTGELWIDKNGGFPVKLAITATATGTTAVVFQRLFDITNINDAANKVTAPTTATLLSDGRVLITGGMTGGGAVASAELYDPKTGTFSATGSMATSRYGHTATLLSDGRVLIAGGWNGGGNVASAELYDPKSGIFSSTGSMATARYGHTATLLSDGRVLIAGGVNRYGGYASSVELYDPKTGAFNSTGSMATARYGHTATLLSDGRVLIAGGVNRYGGYASSVELYDPKTGAFSATGSMTTARYGHTATLLSDGRVLIAGGVSGSGDAVASAEVYDPKTGAFNSTGSMATDRYDHTATLLSDGRALITGGKNGSGDAVASAEVYTP